MLAEMIYNPLKEYNDTYKESIRENVKNYFENLVKESGVDEEENKRLVAEYKAAEADYNKKRNRHDLSKNLRALMIIASVIASVIGGFNLVLQIINASNGRSIDNRWFLICIGFLAIGIGLAVLLQTKVKAWVARRNELEANAKALMDTCLDKCYDQIRPLNMLYDFHMPSQLFMQTVPIIELDEEFEMKKLAYMVDKFGLPISNSHRLHSSILGCKSGQIRGNPFVVVRTLNQEWYDETYTGAITYTYSEYVTDSQGKRRRVTRTQIIRASIKKPASRYYNHEQLIFASPAAPELTFSRQPTFNLSNQKMSERKIAKFIKSQNKEQRKLEKSHLMDNDDTTNYTMMANDEFEAMFNSTDRNNEVEFRLMFTPVAQQNMVYLIKDSPYGDDFYFDKENKINYIYSNHAQQFPYDTTPTRYMSYDMSVSRKAFNEFNVGYFDNLYFELAPILAVPLYQETKPFEYIYKRPYASNLTHYDHERLSNGLKQGYLRHRDADTEGINKSKFIRSIGNIDIVDVTNHAFHKVERVEYVSRRAGDGRWVSVPVKWIEYVPVAKTTTCGFVHQEGSSNYVYGNIRKAFDETDIWSATKESLISMTNVAGFTFDRWLNYTDYNRLDKELRAFSNKYLKL